MKIGDPVMRVFKYGGNWIGIVEWVNPYGTVARVKWTSQPTDTHHISVLTTVKKCP